MVENIISKIKIKDIDYDLRAIKSIQDNDGNVISSTYETKTDSDAKLEEAKSYTDSIASITVEDIDEICGKEISFANGAIF